MASIAASLSPAPASDTGVSFLRLCILRAAYLLLAIGLGAMIVPEILSHALTSRGVIASLLGALWLLALLGLRYPLEMLPLLMFELAWKLIWAIAYGLPQYSADRLPPTFAEDSFNIGFGVILMPLVIPWGFVWRRYFRRPGTPWTRTSNR
ncbi:MAG: hypothetical protein ABWX67_02285 [Allosphingosinicella sp.]